MNVYKEQNGIATPLALSLLISLLVISGIGYAVYQTKLQPTAGSQNTTTPDTTSNNYTPPTGIDYPVSQGIQGKVFCNDKIDPVPCSTSIWVKIDAQPENPATESYGPTRTVETDAQGNFSIELVAGSYILTPAPKPGYPLFVPPLPNPVIVKDREMTEISITYHSGNK